MMRYFVDWTLPGGVEAKSAEEAARIAVAEFFNSGYVFTVTDTIGNAVTIDLPDNPDIALCGD